METIWEMVNMITFLKITAIVTLIVFLIFVFAFCKAAKEGENDD